MRNRLTYFLLSLMLSGLSTIGNIHAGTTNPETSVFYYSGDKGLAPKTCLYKIDNKLRNEFTSGFLAFGYNKTHKVGGFEIELSPGNHTFEIVLNDKGVSSNSKSIIAKTLTINMKADCKYKFERDNFDITVICESTTGKSKAEYTLEDVSVFTEPNTSESYASISYTPEKKSEINPFISRIDGKVTSATGDIFGVCNYSLPIDYKYFNNSKGELSLKIAPGIHTIEYLILGERVIDGLVQSEIFTFEAGKNYKIVLEERKSKGKSKTIAAIRFVEI